MTFSHYSGKRQRLPATKISCETRFLPLVDNSPWKQYPVLGDYGPLFWKSIIFWNVFLLAKATSFSVAIFDMGFFFSFYSDRLKKKNYKISKTYKNAATWWMHILIPKMSQLLVNLFFKEKQCYCCAFLFPCFSLPLFLRGKPGASTGVCPSTLGSFAGLTK